MNFRCLLLSVALATATAADDLVIADFDGADYGAWTATGTAFGSGPAHGALDGQQPLLGAAGAGLVDSYHGHDAATGTLTSPAFTIARRHLAMLVGGGADAQRLTVALLVDGAVVRSATGSSSRPDDHELLDWVSWDVAAWQGRQATIVISDTATGGWGHILVDHIVQSDHEHAAAAPAQRAFHLDHPWLAIPVLPGAPKRTLSLVIGGVLQKEFVVELAPGAPAFWTGCDLTPYQGQDAELRIDRVEADSAGWRTLALADTIPGTAEVYHEALRPQFHFSSQRGWLNDPNGLVFLDGEYHLYYQHNPFGTAWENMHWGHAVSPDLVHWRELPPTLWRRHAFSGSAAVDAHNSGGFPGGAGPALVAAWTSTDRGECIAYSRDRGRTFTEIPENPVIRHQGRDPRIFWHAPSQRWVMAVYDESEGKRWIAFYNSSDLRQWTAQSRIEGFYECPDLFELPVADQPGASRWVLTAANGHYLLGRFDGLTFIPDQLAQIAFPAAGNLYAAQTWNDAPDGRRLRIGWFQTELAGMPFNQSMSFPVELTLRTTPAGLRVSANPARELAGLKEHVQRIIIPGALPPGLDALAGASGELLDVQGTFIVPAQGRLALTLRGVPLIYDASQQQLACAGATVPLALVDGRLTLRVLVDRASLEVFADGGLVYMPMAATIAPAERSLHLTATGGIEIADLTVTTLHSAWPAQP